MQTPDRMRQLFSERMLITVSPSFFPHGDGRQRIIEVVVLFMFRHACSLAGPTADTTVFYEKYLSHNLNTAISRQPSTPIIDNRSSIIERRATSIDLVSLHFPCREFFQDLLYLHCRFDRRQVKVRRAHPRNLHKTHAVSKHLLHERLFYHGLCLLHRAW